MSGWLTERQEEAAQKIHKAQKGIVWWKVGEGKTRIALRFYELSVPWEKNRCLVICSPSAIRQWQDEIRQYPFHVINFEECFDFLSYGSLAVYSQSTPRWASFHHNLSNIGTIVLDEIWLYKNPRAGRSLAVHQLVRGIRNVIGLSGSLITNRNIEDLYGQSRAVGIDHLLAGSLTHFRSQFQIPFGTFGTEYAAKRGAVRVIQERLAPSVDIYYPKDVRESRIIKITVDPTPQQSSLFDTVSKEYYANINGKELEIRNAANLITKLQQISDGCLSIGDTDKADVESSKLERLIELLLELREAGQRPIVWFAFKASLERVLRSLDIRSGRKNEMRAATLSSNHVFDHVGWKARKYECCLATIGSGASLNDFADSSYSIIYSAPFSHRALQQAMGRTNRASSPHLNCYYYFLATDTSVDALVYEHLLLTDRIEKDVILSSKSVIDRYMKKYESVHNQHQTL